MKRTTGLAIVLTALAASGAIDIAAQDEVAERLRGRRGPSVEAIMGMRDGLELTDGQLADLEAIRRETVERRNGAMGEMAEMRSQLAAGQIQRSDLMAFMEDRREANAGLTESIRERVDAILTEDQLEVVAQRRGNARAFARGRAIGMRGDRGNFRRGQRSFREGRRGFREGRRGFRGARGEMPWRSPDVGNDDVGRSGPRFDGQAGPGRG